MQVSLHREPPEVGLVEKLTRSLYWWVEQYVPTLHREWRVQPYSLIVNKKEDVGMAKRCSKNYGNKGLAFNYLKSDVKMPVST